MKHILTIAVLATLGACGDKPGPVVVPNPTIVQVPGPTVEVPGPTVVVHDPILPPVACQVFKNWNVTSLPTATQVQGDVEIRLNSLSFTSQNNDQLPFAEFLNTDAATVTHNFAMRCTVDFEVKSAGDHVFTLASDDGSELWINEARVIDNTGPHGVVVKTATVTLPVGVHQILVKYYEGNGPKALSLSVQRPSVTPAPQPL